MAIIEVSAYSAQWATEAQECGANRVELCSNILEGGTTPSIGCVQLARERLKIPLFVIVRPRGGNFLYTEQEFETMYRDIEHLKKLGADGIVLGILNEDLQVDIGKTRTLVDLARPMQVTFHRAFDQVSDPFQALEEVIETGCERILTSGLKPTALEGLNTLIELKKRAMGRIKLLPGSGINSQNIFKLRQTTGFDEFHLSAKMQSISTSGGLKSKVDLNLSKIRETTDYQIDAVELMKVVEISQSFEK